MIVAGLVIAEASKTDIIGSVGGGGEPCKGGYRNMWVCGARGPSDPPMKFACCSRCGLGA